MKSYTSKRSYKRISKSDLFRLAKIALADKNDLFNRLPHLKKLYDKRLICIALCQGAALHYIDRNNGIKDFDVWSFYSESKGMPFPYRRNVHKDFGKSKFGKLPKSKYLGRRVDLLGRSLKEPLGINPIIAIGNYLANNKNKTPKYLAKKAIVIIYPFKYIGVIAWPI
jgi:hypothetical protein